MAQEFNLKYQLVDGHGNFGSVDGDPAAAYRYTEAKLAPFGELMMKGIDENTVTMVPNFDNSEVEAEVLPGLLPLLLMNGTSGIAVGMSASFAPHLAKDVFKAIDKMLDDTIHDIETPIDDVIAIINAPDFPTGGTIVNLAEVHDAYRTGRGKVTVRSKYHFETYGKQKRDAIVVDEIPYKVNKATLVERIFSLAFPSPKDEEKAAPGFYDDFKGKFHAVRDESGREGMRIVMELNKDVPPELMMRKLMGRTDLQANYSINHTALVDGHPVSNLTLLDILNEYLAHACTVIRNRTAFELDKARDRQHILEAIVKALSNLDDTIAIIRKSKKRDTAIKGIMELLEIDQKQAEAIARINLISLNEEDIDRYNAEHDALDKEIAEMETLLNDDILFLGAVKTELRELAAKYFAKEERQTDIATVMDDREAIVVEDIVVAYTHQGYLKSVKLEDYNAQNRGGKGVIFAGKDDDFVESLVHLTTKDNLVVFTDAGKAYVLPAYKVPMSSRTANGKLITNYIEFADDEHVIKFLPVTEDDVNSDSKTILFVTKNGIGKRMKLSDLPSTKAGAKVVSLKDEEDGLVSVSLVNENDDIIVASTFGQILRFQVEKVSVMGRAAAGVKVMKLRNEGDTVVSAFSVKEGDILLQVMQKGYAKRVAEDDVPQKANRGSGGVRGLGNIEKAGQVVGMSVAAETDDCFVITKGGLSLRVPVSSVSVLGRVSTGVKLVNLNDLDEIASVVVVPANESEDE